MKKIFLLSLICLFSFASVAQEREVGTYSLTDIRSDLKLFDDPLATKLNRKTTKRNIARMKNPDLKLLAQALYDKSYDLAYRYSEYKPFLDPVELGKQLCIGSGYSNYENITGILLPKGQHILLVNGIPEGKEDVKLLIPNWERRCAPGIAPTEDPNGWGIVKKEFVLRNGVNVINNEDWDGLAYIYYYSLNPANENSIEVHFVNGVVNGYFDIEKHNDTDWDRLIDDAAYTILDARGKHIQTVYPVADLKKYAPHRGVELINRYDRMMDLQYQFMGLYKYNRVPENRILARVNYNYYMFRDEDGVAYMGTEPNNAMSLVIDPDRLLVNDGACWGFNHEVGHVHQLTPYLTWGGMTEISNNIITHYATTALGNKSSLTKLYNKVRETICNKNVPLKKEKDLFGQLIPFWQLHLYFTKYNHPDFYADLQETFRCYKDTEAKEHGHDAVSYQLNFVKEACRIGKTDLTDFFQTWGFFYVGEFEIDDYEKHQYSMTQEMVDACKKEIKAMNLPKPKEDISLMED